MGTVTSLKGRSPEERARRALSDIGTAGVNMRQAWLDYGAALNDLRVEYASNEQFGQALVSSKLEGTFHPAARSAAMWAASSPDDLAEVEVAGGPEVTPKGGFRGLHAAWNRLEASRAKPKPDPKPKPKPEPNIDEDFGDEDLDGADEVSIADGNLGITPSSHEQAVGAMVLDGEITRAEAETRVGKTNIVVRRIVAWVAGYRSAAVENAVASTLTKTAEEKVAAAIRKRERALDHEVEVRAREMAQQLFDSRMERLEAETRDIHKTLQRNLQYGSGAAKLHPDEHRAMKMVLHPNGNASDEVKTTAWAAWEKLGLVAMTSEDLVRLERQAKFAEDVRRKMQAR